MKILYRQPKNGSILEHIGITKCYLKLLHPVWDRTTKKEHHHMDYELHMILEGGQCYRVADEEFDLQPGSWLLIPPGAVHRVLSSQPQTGKVGITFRLAAAGCAHCRAGQITSRMAQNLRLIEEETAARKEFSSVLVENALLETAVTILRDAGLEQTDQPPQQEEHAVLGLAKQYIEDNIDRAPEVDTVARYCCVSAKQLTRLFRRMEGIPPGEYITLARVARIEALLREGEMTLKQISDQLHFSSEYYLNAFFKKHAGMPPGAYQKMHK